MTFYQIWEIYSLAQADNPEEEGGVYLTGASLLLSTSNELKRVCSNLQSTLEIKYITVGKHVFDIVYVFYMLIVSQKQIQNI